MSRDSLLIGYLDLSQRRFMDFPLKNIVRSRWILSNAGAVAPHRVERLSRFCHPSSTCHILPERLPIAHSTMTSPHPPLSESRTCIFYRLDSLFTVNSRFLIHPRRLLTRLTVVAVFWKFYLGMQVFLVESPKGSRL